MRVESSKYKLWKKNNDLKKFLRSVRKKQKVRKNKKKKNLVNEFFVPKIFSIIQNPEETILFLNSLVEEVERLRNLSIRKIRVFKIEMRDTILITCDALMYLLTIIKNTRGSRFVPINWYGTFPEDVEMQHFLRISGYLNYVHTDKSNLVKTTDNIQIQTGHSYFIHEGEMYIDIRKKIVDFTAEKLKKTKIDINYLMTMLTELITNIDDHAYDENALFEHNWYLFVENKSSKLCYTFMDNGLGIPTTIKKGIVEKILSSLNVDTEYKYIKAAVGGIEKRSQTGKYERGNGLPSIYEPFTNGDVKNMVIVSNRAYYSSTPKDLVNSLYGTIFYWEIYKEESELNDN